MRWMNYDFWFLMCDLWFRMFDLGCLILCCLQLSAQDKATMGELDLQILHTKKISKTCYNIIGKWDIKSPKGNAPYKLESGALFFIVLRFLLSYQFKLPCFHKIILYISPVQVVSTCINNILSRQCRNNLISGYESIFCETLPGSRQTWCVISFRHYKLIVPKI